MLRRLQHLLVNNLSVFNINNSDLWRLSEVLPQFALVGGYSYSLIHDRMVLEISAKIVLLQQIQLQLLFQKLRRISHTVRALAEDNARPNALEHLALGGTVALLELGHDLPHAFSCHRLVLGGQSQDDACPDKSTTGTFHVAHARTKGVAQVTACFFIDSNQVGISANDCLGAVVRAVLQFLYCYVFSGVQDFSIFFAKVHFFLCIFAKCFI